MPAPHADIDNSGFIESEPSNKFNKVQEISGISNIQNDY